MNLRVLATAVAAAVVIGGGALYLLSSRSGPPESTADTPVTAAPAAGEAVTPAAPAEETPRPTPVPAGCARG